MSRPLRDVADDPSAGRKAQVLARLLAAGLPVSPGVVVGPDDALDTTLEAAIAGLGGGPYAVRSSSALEDGVAGSAAGLYESIIGVGAPGVLDAIRTVRASAHDPAVRAYLEARSLESRPIAVLVQAAVHADVLGVARATDQGYFVEERRASSPEWSDSNAFELVRGANHPVAALLARAEPLLPGAIDVEYARTNDDVVLLQARPVTARSVGTARRYPSGRWRFDAEHNPDPISVAQADLVQLVEGARFGRASRVIDGFLYVREERLGPRRAADPLALARFHEELEPVLRGAIAAASDAPLADALGAYRDTMRRYASEVRPPVAIAHRELDELLQTHLGQRLDEHRRLLSGTGGATSERDDALYQLGREPTQLRLSEFLRRYGAYAPAWDVEVPCDDEQPQRVLAVAARRALGPSPVAMRAAANELASEARRQLRQRVPAALRDRFDTRLDLLRALGTLAESDDLLFFEAQRLVRRALLRRGKALVAARRLDRPSDVFSLTLALARGESGDLRVPVAEAKAARKQAERRVPPYRIADGRALVRLPDGGEVLRGRPAGGHGRGRAFVVRSLTQSLDDLPEGAVLVLPAALPSLAPHLPQLAALVTEHGGALSHAITLARECGVAAVVGASGALDIPQGAELYVDGERGRVVVIRR